MKLLYGTKNPSKISVMEKKLKQIGIEVTGLDSLNTVIPDVLEDGNTPLENARKKALAYYKAFGMPVFSCDSGLYFDHVPEYDQPGVHVRTIGGKYLTDEEMLNHYSNLAKKYGDLTARYRNAICLVLGEDKVFGAMEKNMESEPFLLTSIPHKKRKKGFPLDSLSIDLRTGKYYYDLEEEALDRVAVEDEFLEFFRKHL